MDNITLNEDTDFLDILRYLNSDNFTENSNLTEALFQLLHGPLDIAVRRGYYFEEYCCGKIPDTSVWMYNKYMEEYNLSDTEVDLKRLAFFTNSCLYVVQYIMDDSLKDNGKFLEIDYKFSNSCNSIIYFTNLLVVFNILKEEHKYFNKFKLRLLEALIISYCLKCKGENYIPKIDIKRFNKLIVIYAECKGYLQHPDEFPLLIDSEFLIEIKENLTILDYNKSLSIINKLLNRKLIINHKK